MTEQQPANQSQYDVVIIGGGMVGASLACALLPAICDHGLTVALVETYPLPENSEQALYQPSYDDRSTALSYGSRCLLQQLGVWQKLSEHVTPIEHIHVSDKGRFGAARLHASEHGIDALGYVVENAWLGRVLLQQLIDSRAVDCFTPASVSDIVQIAGDGGATCQQIKLQQGDEEQRLVARLAVVADGGRSPVCQQLGLDVHKSDYQQYAIVANVSAERNHGNVAYERFTPDGPVALLPLHEQDAPQQNRSALVFTAAVEDVVDLMEMSEQAFLAALQLRFGYRLGQFTHLGKRDSYPLTLQRIKEQVRPGLAVVGNAAHTLHPVAGQGFNLALRGLMALAESINNAAATNDNPGDFARLQAYFTEQQRDQDKTIAFTDQLLKVFGSDSALMKKARGRGLLALEFFNPAKQLFARQAMGLGDALPRMAGGDHS
ncbi:2-octaprenyl-6-methoxyphenol hydroxylase [gamma proteobacterium IMCC2047]|nr:2-octaprenyl-6-methoxyphenol hydroxylase [gamma proteobacterium IMCC2047]